MADGREREVERAEVNPLALLGPVCELGRRVDRDANPAAGGLPDAVREPRRREIVGMPGRLIVAEPPRDFLTALPQLAIDAQAPRRTIVASARTGVIVCYCNRWHRAVYPDG